MYEDGYDGHCLRAYAYFGNQMPDIRQAGENEKTFTVKVKGQDLLMKSGDFIVESDGTKIPIERYYETYKQL